MTTTPDQTFAALDDLAKARPAGTEVGISVLHPSSGARWDHNGEGDFASASTVKILILAALARAFDAGRLDPDDARPAPAGIRLGGSGVLNWLDADLALKLRDHAWLMTAISDNSSSNVCIEAVGLEDIAATGDALGAGGTRLARRFMGADAPPGPPKNRATANGLVNILDAIEHDRAASPECCAWMRQLLADQQHLDRLPRHVPEDVSYRGKTGTIEGINHDCGVLEGPRGTVIVAVLTEGFTYPRDADRFIGKVGTACAALVAGDARTED